MSEGVWKYRTGVWQTEGGENAGVMDLQVICIVISMGLF